MNTMINKGTAYLSANEAFLITDLIERFGQNYIEGQSDDDIDSYKPFTAQEIMDSAHMKINMAGKKAHKLDLEQTEEPVTNETITNSINELHDALVNLQKEMRGE